jgi:hypothetical protein
LFGSCRAVGVASRSTRHATRTVCRHLLSIYFLPYSRCRVPYYADGSWLKLERRSTHGSTGGDRAVSVTSPEAERAQRHLHCTTAPRAQTGRFCFGSCRARGPPRGDRLGMSARSDGFFIPYRVPYGQRANQVISLRIISKQYTVQRTPATGSRSGPAIVRQSCAAPPPSGPAILRPSSSAHGATHGRYLGATANETPKVVPRGLAPKQYEPALAHLCPRYAHVMPTEPTTGRTIPLTLFTLTGLLSPSRCHQKC